MKNTVIKYMYRDAANYKLFFEEVVAGLVPQTYVDELSALGEDLDFMEFYPEKVGLPAPTFVDIGYAPYDDDPTCHELIGLDYTEREPTVDMTAEQLIDALKQDGVFGSVSVFMSTIRTTEN